MKKRREKKRERERERKKRKKGKRERRGFVEPRAHTGAVVIFRNLPT